MQCPEVLFASIGAEKHGKNYYLLPYGCLNRSTTPTEIKSTTPAKLNKKATP